MQYYAHSANASGEWEPLETHLEKTAVLAKGFADSFAEGTAGKWLGIFHDIGKASPLFQEVLHQNEHHVNHWAAGAGLLQKHRLLSRVIYAHHKGLVWDIGDDLKHSVSSHGSCDSQAGRRFAVSGAEEYKEAAAFVRRHFPALKESPALIENGVSFYEYLPEMLHTRMLLSCLVDADYLATASHDDDSILEYAAEVPLDAQRILMSLDHYRSRLRSRSHADGKLNSIREQVYADCLEAAQQRPGMFTLTAPTGTGKTLALLAFSAAHALEHQKRRIIVVLPFLSIISQNAAIYQEICGDVLEAHSMASYGDHEEMRLMAERWNAPVIITTSVKFFEAFFKSSPSDLRFLHSIADSVIVFDEAQSIPAELVGTTMETMRMLCEMFRCTVLFSTATQPAFDLRRDIVFQPYEVISDPPMLYERTRRVSVEWNIEKKMPLEEIAEEMAGYVSVCCVLNRKDHVRKLYDQMRMHCPADECFHISTDMCKVHRDAVLTSIRERLEAGLPCRLVSTSCIEAGVDLDFSCMYRALAPLEAIVQCAGRCNRNGRQEGRMVVFLPDEEKLYPADFYRNAAEKVKLLLSRHPVDLCNPEHIREYYMELYMDRSYDHDKLKLQKAIADHDFAEAEKQYRFIPQSGVNVLVPYEEEMVLFCELTEEARTKGISKSWMRRAAPITVTSYYEDKLRDLAEKCWMHTKHGKDDVPGWYILLSDECYNTETGLHFSEESSMDYLI